MTKKWTEFTVGIIMMVSPWVLGFSDISLAKWCNVLLGLIIVLMSAWAIFGVAQVVLVPEEVKKESIKIKTKVEK